MIDETTLFNAKRINGVDVPVVLLGDSAFRLSTSLMKPYPFNATNDEAKKTFNYALSKWRRVVENAFGQLKARSRRIGKGVDNHVEKAPFIILTCCMLNNFMNCHNSNIVEKWVESTSALPQPEHSNVDFDPSAENIRKAIAAYVNK